jgi:hypothetical protein
MLTLLYIEALLVDEKLADFVWEAWDADETDDQVAWLAWWLVANHGAGTVDNTDCYITIWHNERTK